MEYLQNIDQIIFNWINQDLSNAIFDRFFVIVRNKYTWLPLYLFLISFFIFNFKKKGLIIMLLAFITVGISDFTSATLIKPRVERVRPCNDIEANPNVISRIKCGIGYSFPSSHASNHFALGVFFFFIFISISKTAAYLFLIWAGLISFAQIYVGVHYPIDILVGAILGIIIGALEYKFYKQIEIMYFVDKNNI